MPAVPWAPWAPFLRTHLPPPPAFGQVQLWLFSLDTPPWPSAELHAVLEPAERSRAERFHFDTHRLRFAHGRGALRLLLAHATGTDAAAIRFEFGAQGKPRLAGAPAQPGRGRWPALDFNLSHSGAWALLGLSDGAPIGVDIELPRPVPELHAIAERNFAPGEQRALFALAPERQAEAFLACWTRKEAFVKALGGGLSVPLTSFEVSLAPDDPPRLLCSPAHPAEAYTLWAGRTPHGAEAAAIVRRPGASVQTCSLT